MHALRTGLAAALLTLACTFGLVFVNTPPAEALVPPPIILTGLEGATAEAGGAATVGGLMSNPVGWGIGAAALGWLAWSKRDAIMDFLNPDPTRDLQGWCNTDPTCDPSHWSTHYADTNVSIDITVSGRDVTTHIKCLNVIAGGTVQNPYYGCGSGTAGHTLRFSADPATTSAPTKIKANCKKTDGTVFSITSLPATFASVSGGSTSPTGLDKTIVTTVSGCTGTGTVLTGLSVPPQDTYAGTEYRQIATGLAWGDLTPSAFPSGAVTFGNYDVDVTCKNNTTGATQHIEVLSPNDGSGHAGVPSCAARLGADWHMSALTITPNDLKVGGIPVDPSLVPKIPPFKWTEPQPGDADWNPSIADPFGPNMGLWIDDEPCNDDRPVCEDWVELNKEHPERVKCRNGGKFVATKYCLPLAYAYQPGKQSSHVGTDPGTDQHPGDGTSPEPTLPDDGTTGPKAPLDPADAPTQTKCFPHGWGAFNPFAWIYKPVICALKDAFVPTQSWSSWSSALAAAFTGKAPFTWISSLSSLPSSISAGGCPTDWVFHFQGRDYPILCGTAAGDRLHSYRPLITVLVLGAAVYPLLRSLVYSVIPIVRPEPSSGGDA